jgi:7-cyano-7-deazaguanine reductase
VKEIGAAGSLLGRHTPAPQEYSPDILHAIPRKLARDKLQIAENLPFHGVDLWHAYEISWLDQTGKPAVFVGKFSVPAQSPNIVESKSFKLYLNSLNSTRFPSVEQAHSTIVTDISAAAGDNVSLELLAVDDDSLQGSELAGESLDSLAVSSIPCEPHKDQLQVQSGHIIEEMVYSHLLRSLCPVTGQPDWATLWIHYGGTAIEHSSLLEYIISYRNHQEFHEQCVERVFQDLKISCEPTFLHVQAFYTRRGGLDISPFRSTDSNALPRPRLARQ